jgi:hypothetical protein
LPPVTLAPDFAASLTSSLCFRVVAVGDGSNSTVQLEMKRANAFFWTASFHDFEVNRYQ